jgi:hypothetical protein
MFSMPQLVFLPLNPKYSYVCCAVLGSYFTNCDIRNAMGTIRDNNNHNNCIKM